MKPIYHMDIPEHLWLKRFNREQLRNMAQEYGIKRGRNAADTARNLACGIGASGTMVKFEMDLFNPAKPNAAVERTETRKENA